MIMRRIPLYCLLLFLFLPTLTHAKIIFRSVVRGAGAGLYVMDDDGRNIQRLTDDGWWPVWSPDGKQIAFTKKPPGVPNWPQISAIYIINSDGTDEYRFTDEDTFENYPTWSPDGKYIAFSSNRLAKPGVAQRDIWRINLETKALRRLTRIDGKVALHPSWSPDGTYIVYWQEGSRFNLMDADGRRRRSLGTGGSRPRWSPDSQSIVYSQDIRDANREFITSKVVIHNINTDKRQILDTPDNWNIYSTCFMGSKQVLIVGRHWDKENPHHKFDIYSYHLVTGELVNLTNTPDDDDFTMDWISDDVLSVSPKGDPKKVTVTWGEIKQ